MNHARERKEKRHRQSSFVDKRSNYAELRKMKRPVDAERIVNEQVRIRASNLRPIAPRLPPQNCPYGHNENITCPICDLLE